MITKEEYIKALDIVLAYHKQLNTIIKYPQTLIGNSPIKENIPNKVVLEKHYIFLINKFNLDSRTESLFRTLVDKYNTRPVIGDIVKKVSIDDMYRLPGYSKSTIEPIIDILLYYNIKFKK